jgi:hypothetical protein
MGKLTIIGVFSIAMLNYQRVAVANSFVPEHPGTT